MKKDYSYDDSVLNKIIHEIYRNELKDPSIYPSKYYDVLFREGWIERPIQVDQENYKICGICKSSRFDELYKKKFTS